MAAKFRGRVGTQRISQGLNPSQASYTRSVRSQMKAIEANVSEFINTVRSVTPNVLRKALEPMFKKSQEYVPVDTSDLKNSGYLNVEQKGKLIQAEIGYGKAGDPYYAVYVHERTDLAHTAPTRSKYLQAAVTEELPNLNNRLKKAFREELKT